ncbi:MAG: amino acid adenylation domain-containing protein [Candidatus Hydrogenedentes bacterium]|nr:amino acid adenylation domain-containing protein [Candidatus Hydrogenedentota bacterium]
MTQLSSFGFDAAVMDIYGALLNGATLLPVDLKDVVLEEVHAWLEAQGATLYHSTPSVFRALTAALGRRTFTTVRAVVLGGEETRRDDVERFRAHFNNEASFVNLYGSAEASFSSVYVWEGEELRRASVPVGRSVDRTDVLLLNEYGEESGVFGEIAIRSRHVALGYWNKDAQTQAVFQDIPESDGLRVYRTGDLGRRLPDGSIECRGRKDFQVKLRGYRIEPAEIEAALKNHASVADCVVVLLERGAGDKALAAYVVSREAVTAKDLRAHLEGALPEYMIPSAFTMLEAMPLSPNGKVDRRRLPEAEWGGVGDGGDERPRTVDEEVLAGIWCSVLRVEKIGVHDRFFDLGGHSLLATQVVSRVRDAFNVDLPLRALFEAPTVAGLAERIESLRRERSGHMAPPLAPVKRDGLLPLSFSQQRLWILDQLGVRDGAYTMTSVLRLRGTLHREALESAFTQLIARHESLRTVFVSDSGELYQRILDPYPFTLTATSIENLPQEMREVAALRSVSEDSTVPFDLEKGPILRARLYRLSSDDHVLAVMIHHIASDAWSMGVLVREVCRLYEANASGASAQLPVLPIQYADFAVWQRDWLQGEALEQQLDYWRQHLSGAPAALDLPADRPRPAIRSFQGARASLALPQELLDAAKDLARATNTTLFMVLMALYKVLLYRYTGQTDVVVGTPIANRNRREVEGLIGFFVNTLAMRTRFKQNSTYRDVLAAVRESALAAYAHQDLPFDRLVAELQPERDLSRSPLFQVMFVLQNVPRAEERLPGLSVTRMAYEARRARFDVTMTASEHGGGLMLGVEYNTDLFEPDTMRRFLEHFRNLLAAFVRTPDAAIDEPDLMDDAERARVLYFAQPPHVHQSSDVVATRMIEAQARRAPHAVALRFEGSSITYEALNARANQLARYLRDRGIARESLVGVAIDRSPEMIVAVLATMKACAAYLPLDPGYPDERLHFMIDDARPQAILTRRADCPRLAVHENAICLDAIAEVLSQFPTSNLGVAPEPCDLAYVIYTSGSTGKPKGTLIEHRGLPNLIMYLREQFDKDHDTRVLQFASLSFDASVWEIFPALGAGCSLILASREIVSDPERLTRLVQWEGVTMATLPPTVLSLLDPDALPSLRTVISAGERCPAELAARWTPGRRFVNGYGPTETTVCATLYECDGSETHTVPIGRPVTNAHVYVLDSQCKPVPAGIPGDICVAGVGLARGYLNRPELTQERFIPNPFGDTWTNQLYKTGDRGRLRADGHIEYLGRSDDQVKLRGFRIELGEIENCLRALSAIANAAVILREDTPGDPRLVAYLVPRNTRSFDAAACRSSLTAQLPAHMIPSAFVTLDALPLSPNGKVDVRALPAPERVAVELRGAEPPATAMEQTLAAIWREVLSIERFGRHDRFFDLGGHSLKAAQVVSRIRSSLGVELPLRAIFEEPSLAGLAARVESLQSGAAQQTPTSIVPRRDGRPARLSFAQQRLWFLDRLGSDDGVYTISVALRLRGTLDPGALQNAIGRILERHEVLRTVFAGSDEEPRQFVHADIAPHLDPVDLSALPDGERDGAVRRLVREALRKPFDLTEGPLFRALLVRLDAAEHVLGVSMHHTVSDGWSMGVFARELELSYSAFAAGEQPDMPTLPIQYADFAEWQRDYLRGEVLDQQVCFWKQHLKGAPPALDLPTDRPRPAVQTFRGGRASIALPAALRDGMAELCRRHEVTPFMALSSAFAVLLHRYTGQEDLVIGTPIANRNRAELEGLIGFFANTLPLRFRVHAQMPFLDLLLQVRETALAAQAHQDVPFEKLVEELVHERSLARTPLFQVMFAVQNVNAALPHLPGLDVSRFDIPAQRSRFELTVTVSETAQGFSVSAEYNTDLFDAATVERMLEHFGKLVHEIVRHDKRAVSEIPLILDKECAKLLELGEGPQVSFDTAKLVHHLVEEQAARRPGALALEDGEAALTYDALNRRANRMAHRLASLGVAPESRVAVCVSRRLDMAVALLAVLKAGGAYVPLDPNYPDERLRHMAIDCDATALITCASEVGRFSACEIPTMLVEDAGALSAVPDSNPYVPIGASNLAYVIYTSGSTGRPKGVLIEHHSLLNLVHWHRRAFGVCEDDRATQLAGVAFDASVWELWPYLTCGASISIPTESTRLSASALHQWLIEKRISITFMPTPLAEQALDCDWPSDGPLRYLLTGGDTLHRYPERSLPFTLVNNYGPTENTVVTTSGHVPVCAQPVNLPSLGRPIDNTRVCILDAHLRPVPRGVAGELHIGGPGLARGYLNQPELTQEKFIPDPFSTDPAARLYKTGDLARFRPDGTLEFLGRTDHQVKIRGFRIELGEIESVLRLQNGVGEAIVLPRPNGPSGPSLAAFVVPSNGARVEPSVLRESLKAQLPAYMVPSTFTLADFIPVSAHGKVDREALLSQVAESASESNTPHVEPSTESEIQIAAIWKALLGRDRISAHDNFLDIGGHSMLAVAMVSRVSDAFGMEIPLRWVFEAPTVAGLGRKIDELRAPHGDAASAVHPAGGRSESWPDVVVPIRTAGNRAPIFLIAPAGGTIFAYYALAHHLGHDQPVFALQDPAYEGRRAPCESLEEMASCYIEAIRAVQPHGPYHIGGWSLGGTVAFEMAQQLRGEVGLLFLIETITGLRAPSKGHKPLSQRLRHVWENMGHRMSFALSGLVTTVEGARHSIAASPVGRTLLRLLRLANGRGERAFRSQYERAMNRSAGDVRGGGTMLMNQAAARHWVSIALANMRAFKRYTPKPYNGRITLFLAERRANARPAVDPSRGWSKLTTAEVDVHTLPGDHFSILRNTNAARFAGVLRGCIDALGSTRRAQSENEQSEHAYTGSLHE